MSKIILETILESIATRVDGTMKITLSTQEIDPATAVNLFQLRGKFCKSLISDSNITKLEEELVDSTPLVSGKKNKSESQRLRAVLFLLSQQMQQDFEPFYKQKMEDLILHFKSKLE